MKYIKSTKQYIEKIDIQQSVIAVLEDDREIISEAFENVRNFSFKGDYLHELCFFLGVHIFLKL